MLYPVRIFVGDTPCNYAMITLEQANQKYIVINGCLVEQAIVPMDADYVQQQLTYRNNCLLDDQESYDACPSHWEERRTKILKAIEVCKADIAILTQAKKHYKDLNQI